VFSGKISVLHNRKANPISEMMKLESKYTQGLWLVTWSNKFAL